MKLQHSGNGCTVGKAAARGGAQGVARGRGSWLESVSQSGTGEVN